MLAQLLDGQVEGPPILGDDAEPERPGAIGGWPQTSTAWRAFGPGQPRSSAFLRAATSLVPRPLLTMDGPTPVDHAELEDGDHQRAEERLDLRRVDDDRRRDGGDAGRVDGVQQQHATARRCRAALRSVAAVAAPRTPSNHATTIGGRLTRHTSHATTAPTSDPGKRMTVMPAATKMDAAMLYSRCW